MKEGRINISIKRSTRDKLVELGNKADTYDSIINKLIDAYSESPE